MRTGPRSRDYALRHPKGITYVSWMTPTYRRLRTLFHGIVTTGLTAAAGCKEEVDPPYPASAFDASVCLAGNRDWIDAIHPDPSVDAVMVRSTYGHYPGTDNPLDAGGADTTFTGIVGTPCAHATDPIACQASVDALPPVPLLYDGTGTYINEAMFSSWYLQLATTHGDSVEIIADQTALAPVLGAIDTEEEAYLMAIAGSHYRPACGRTNARTIEDGFEVLVVSGSACGTVDYQQNILRVRTDGRVSLVGRRILELADPNCVIGRLTDGVRTKPGCPRTIGEHLAHMAALEAAAVIAFERLADELVALDAPTALVERARRAARDEIRHAALVDVQRERFGAARVDVESEPRRGRDRFTIALENAQEGMVRETYGALAATYQAEHANDRELARMLRAIAVDETRHAALAHDVGRFLEEGLDDDERRAIDDVRRDTAATLGDTVAVDFGVEMHELMGWPRPEVARALVQAAFPSAWG